MTDRTRHSLLRRLIFGFSRRRKLQFVGVFLFTLGGAGAELIGIGAVLPFLQLVAAPESMSRMPVVQQAISLVGGREVADLIMPAAALLVAAAILASAARMALVWINFRFVGVLTYDLSMLVFSRTIRQPYGMHVRRNTAEVLSGIEKVNYVGAYLLAPLLQALSSAVIAAAIMVLLFLVDSVTATIAAVVMGAAYVGIGLLSRPVLLRMGKRLAALSTERVKLAQESFGGIRDIILDRSHPMFERQFGLVDAEVRKISANVGFISSAPRYLIEAAAIILIAVLALYYTGRPGGVIGAVPVLGALALGAQRLLPLLQNISSAWVQYASTSGLLSDLFKLIDGPVLSSGSTPHKIVPLAFERSIELRGLGFSYSDSHAVVNVDLLIPKGARIGFIGRTGSGKSTLLDLVMGLLEPTSGCILVDGVPLQGETLARWQAQIAHVPQSIFLTDDSIAANIAFGSSPDAIDLEQVRRAAALADIHEFIETLPHGYGTRVGERGVRLSGGQRQRIGIARALYKRAAVLVLDEATSALDDSTEAVVMRGIENLDRSLTVLLIAHRLSTVAACDMVVRLEGGRIAETGTYREVVRKER